MSRRTFRRYCKRQRGARLVVRIEHRTQRVGPWQANRRECGGFKVEFIPEALSAPEAPFDVIDRATEVCALDCRFRVTGSERAALAAAGFVLVFYLARDWRLYGGHGQVLIRRDTSRLVRERVFRA
jgi:hypothetical protein